MSPPRKDVLFNPQLTASDGLLQQEMVKNYHLTYQEAETMLRESIKNWNHQLDMGQTLVISNVGMFRKNLDGKIIFKQFAQSNFLKDAFGLEIAKIAVGKVDKPSEVSIAHRNKTETIVIEKLPLNYRRFQKASAAAIVFLSMSALYLYMLSFNPQAVDRAGLNFFNIPIIDSADLAQLERTKFIEEEIEAGEKLVPEPKPKAKEPTPEDTVENQDETGTNETATNESSEEVKEPAQQEAEEIAEDNTPTPAADEPATPAKSPVLVDKETTQSQFHVIVSVLSSVDGIDTEVNKFKLKGYEPVILPAEVGKYRISIGSFATRDSASTFKKNIYNDNSIDSWILKQ